MAVFLIGGEKGGTGKSTLATNLAIMASLSKRDVILLDCDKQQSSHNFINHRNELQIKPTPPCVQIRGKHLYAEIENLAKRYQDIIIDAGGQDSVEMRSAMVAPSVTAMYIPIQASAFDLQTLVTIDELVEFSQAYNSKLKAYAVVNRASTHSKITKTNDAVDFIQTLNNISISSSKLCERIAFQYAVSSALSVVEFEKRKIMELPSYRASSYEAKASSEIKAIYYEIFHQNFDENLIDIKKLEEA